MLELTLKTKASAINVLGTLQEISFYRQEILKSSIYKEINEDSL
jgi:hypothetical protein